MPRLFWVYWVFRAGAAACSNYLSGYLAGYLASEVNHGQITDQITERRAA